MFLQARGQLGEALIIFKEEVLPVMERVGEPWSRAATIGRIADILQARGQLDEALSMHLERLPIAEATGDPDNVAHIKFRCAGIRLLRGGWKKGEARTIFEELVQSFATAQKVERPDAIGTIGAQFGRVLGLAGRRVEALEVLDQAAGAFETLKQIDNAAKVRALQVQTIPTVEPELPEKSPAARSSPVPVSEPVTRGDSSELGTASQPAMEADKAEYAVWYATVVSHE